MRFVPWAIRCACLGAFALGADVCLAQESGPVQLTWESPKNCPQQPEVEQRLLALVGPSSGETLSPLRAHGTIEPLGESYRLTLFIERSATHGTRVIESEDCRSLGKAAAVVLGLLVQKERLLGRELSESEISGQPAVPPKPEKPPPPPVAPPPPPPPPPLPRPEPRRWYALLRAPQGTVDFLTLPRVGYGVGLGVGVEYQGWRALAAATLYRTQNDTSNGLRPSQIAYGRKSLELLGCRGWRSGAFEIAPCAVLAADAVTARASGANLVSQDHTALWFSIGGGISGYLHLHRHVALVATGSGLIATKRTRFLLETEAGSFGILADTQQVHRIPQGTVGASLGCEWIF